MIITIVFVSSLFLAIILVLIKAIELKYNKKNTVLEFISRLDHKSEVFVSNSKFIILQLVQSVRFIVIVESKNLIRKWLSSVEQKLLDEYQKKHNIMMGKKSFGHNGSASFYLKKITENKSSIEKGKIIDSI